MVYSERQTWSTVCATANLAILCPLVFYKHRQLLSKVLKDENWLTEPRLLWFCSLEFYTGLSNIGQNLDALEVCWCVAWLCLLSDCFCSQNYPLADVPFKFHVAAVDVRHMTYTCDVFSLDRNVSLITFIQNMLAVDDTVAEECLPQNANKPKSNAVSVFILFSRLCFLLCWVLLVFCSTRSSRRRTQTGIEQAHSCPGKDTL